MIRTRAMLVAALFALFATGCFEVEQSIELKRDLSGTANFKLGVDMEPMVMIMAKVQKEMGGDKSPLTKAEIAAAKADFKKNAKKSTTESEDPRKEAEGGLPPGVKLLDVSVAEKEFGVTTNMKFAFDKISSLVGVKLGSKKEGGPPADPTKKSIIDTPFQGLEISETASTISIHTKPQNPAEKVKAETSEQAPKLDPDTEKMMNDAFKNLRVAWKITAPFEVASSNATRKEGNTLIWEYDWEKLQKLAASKKALDDLAVRVTYKK
jgi:cytochrome c556